MSTSQHVEPLGALQLFPRDRGPAGIRNRVLVIPSVICSHFVADEIAERIPGALSASHDHGCAQLGSDKEATHRTLVNIGLNPNVAGALVVGLGCESVQSDEVVADITAGGLPVDSVVIQDEGGTDPCIERGVESARELVQPTVMGDRTTGDLSDLTVGIVSSDLRKSTLDVGEPLVRSFIDRIVEDGGRVIVAGTERFLAAEDALTDQLATQDARDGFRHLRNRTREAQIGTTATHRRAASIDSTDRLALIGDHPVKDVVRYGDVARHERGIGLVDAPMRFEEAATGLVAAGAHLIVHVTAEGIPTGHPVAPVLKVTGNPETAAALPDDIDVDATEAAERELFDRVAAIASGEKSCAEVHGVYNFAISEFGPKM